MPVAPSSSVAGSGPSPPVGRHRRLAVERTAVVAARLDAGGRQGGDDLVGPGMGDHVEVPGGVAAVGHGGHPHVLRDASVAVGGAAGAAAVRPGVEVRQQHTQDGGLDLVQARVVAHVVEGLLVPGAMEAQRARQVGGVVTVGDDRPAVSERTQVLGRDRRRRSPRVPARRPSCRRAAPRPPGRRPRAPAPPSSLRSGAGSAEQVDGEDRRRTRRQRRAYGVDGDVAGVEVDVAEHRPGARVDDRLGAGVEGVGRDHHVVAGLDPERAQAHGDGVRAVGDADHVADPEIVGELPLEGLHVGAEHEAPVGHDLGDALEDRLAQRSQRRGGVELGDGHGGHTRRRAR